MTRHEALTADTFHFTGRHPCARVVGPRGGITEAITVARRNGMTQTWQRDPARYRVPVKHGFYEYATITHDNAAQWHTEATCPLRAQNQQ